MIDIDIIRKMEKMGYRFVGEHKHSAVKICEWCRKAIRGTSVCYKQQFYGIHTHRCIQMTPAVFSCTENCKFCWRTFDYKKSMFPEKWDNPTNIIDEMIEAQREILRGFGGNKHIDKKIYEEALDPNQVAISLAGEPTIYPFLPEFIEELHKRKMTSFLVTNGTIPEMVKKMIQKQPTQLYVTLAAPNEDIFKKTTRPLIGNAWDSLMKTLSMLKHFKRTVIRMTLVKGLNMLSPEQYADIIERASPNFVEAKAFMSIGGARERLPITSMPLHSQIRDFSKEIEKYSSYRIADEKKDSRVVVLTKNGERPSHVSEE